MAKGLDEALKNINGEKTKMKKKYTKKQITEAIAYWKNQLKKMNESAESEKYHHLQSYTELEDKETANCVLMCKPSKDGNNMLFRWVPYDEIYDMRFKNHWMLSPTIDDNEERYTHESIRQSIDKIYDNV